MARDKKVFSRKKGKQPDGCAETGDRTETEKSPFVSRRPAHAGLRQFPEEMSYQNARYDTMIVEHKPPRPDANTILKRDTNAAILVGHTNYIYSVLPLKNNFLASGARDNTIRIWDLNKNQCVRTLTGHTNYIHGLGILPEQTLVSAGYDGTVRFWNITNGTEIEHRRIPNAHVGGVLSLTVLPNGNLVTGGCDCAIRVWNVSTNECLVTLQHDRRNTCPDNYVNSLASLSENRLVSVTSFGEVCIWDINKKQCLSKKITQSNVRRVLALPNDRFATAEHNAVVKIWDINNDYPIKTLDKHTHNGYDCYVYGLSLLPNGYLVSAGYHSEGYEHSSIKVWDLSTLECVQTIEAGQVMDLCTTTTGDIVTGNLNNRLERFEFVSWKAVLTPISQAIHRDIGYIRQTDNGVVVQFTKNKFSDRQLKEWLLQCVQACLTPKDSVEVSYLINNNENKIIFNSGLLDLNNKLFTFILGTTGALELKDINDHNLTSYIDLEVKFDDHMLGIAGYDNDVREQCENIYNRYKTELEKKKDFLSEYRLKQSSHLQTLITSTLTFEEALGKVRNEILIPPVIIACYSSKPDSLSAFDYIWHDNFKFPIWLPENLVEKIYSRLPKNLFLADALGVVKIAFEYSIARASTGRENALENILDISLFVIYRDGLVNKRYDLMEFKCISRSREREYVDLVEKLHAIYDANLGAVRLTVLHSSDMVCTFGLLTPLLETTVPILEFKGDHVERLNERFAEFERLRHISEKVTEEINRLRNVAIAQIDLQNQLTQACYDADIYRVKELVEQKGVDPAMPDKNGQQPLAAAIWGTAFSVINYLQARVQYTKQDWQGVSIWLQNKHGVLVPFSRRISTYGDVLEHYNSNKARYFYDVAALEKRRCDLLSAYPNKPDMYDINVISVPYTLELVRIIGSREIGLTTFRGTDNWCLNNPSRAQYDERIEGTPYGGPRGMVALAWGLCDATVNLLQENGVQLTEDFTIGENFELSQSYSSEELHRKDRNYLSRLQRKKGQQPKSEEPELGSDKRTRAGGIFGRREGPSSFSAEEGEGSSPHNSATSFLGKQSEMPHQGDSSSEINTLLDAILRDDIAILEKLCQSKSINWFEADKNENNVFHFATKIGTSEALKILIKYMSKDARKNLLVNCNSDSEIPLHVAVRQQNVEIVRLLINALDDDVKVCLQTMNNRGYLPLHEAAERGLKEIAHDLIKAGAEIRAKTADDQTAQQLAEVNGHERLSKFLEKLASEGNNNETINIEQRVQDDDYNGGPWVVEAAKVKRNHEFEEKRNKNKNIAMKTQNYGTAPGVVAGELFCIRLGSISPLGIAARVALKNYRKNRENGDDQNNPNSPFPSAGFDALDIKSSYRKSSNDWPDKQGRYWWQFKLNGGQVIEDFYWTRDELRGFPDKSYERRYWFIVHHKNGAKIEGFFQEPDYNKGFPDDHKIHWYTIRFTDTHCLAIRQWMEEKDRNYLERLQREETTNPKPKENPENERNEKVTIELKSSQEEKGKSKLEENEVKVEEVISSRNPQKGEKQGEKQQDDGIRVVHEVKVFTKEELNKEEPAIARGGFSWVYRGYYAPQRLALAIKELFCQQLTQEAQEEFKQETVMLMQLQACHYVVKLYGISLSPYTLVQEYMAKGSLHQVLHSQEDLSWALRIRMALDIGCGLAYLHEHRILHRDLKSRNVLVNEQYRAKLSDFGLAKVRKASHALSHRRAGTTAWMAPELLSRKRGEPLKYSNKSDVYSYGMVLWELSSREEPFKDAVDESEMARWVLEKQDNDEGNEKEKIPENTPPKLSKWIKRCWFNEPHRRPEAKEITEDRDLRAEEVVIQVEQASSSSQGSSSASSSGNNENHEYRGWSRDSRMT